MDSLSERQDERERETGTKETGRDRGSEVTGFIYYGIKRRGDTARRDKRVERVKLGRRRENGGIQRVGKRSWRVIEKTSGWRFYRERE